MNIGLFILLITSLNIFVTVNGHSSWIWWDGVSRAVVPRPRALIGDEVLRSRIAISLDARLQFLAHGLCCGRVCDTHGCILMYRSFVAAHIRLSSSLVVYLHMLSNNEQYGTYPSSWDKYIQGSVASSGLNVW